MPRRRKNTPIYVWLDDDRRAAYDTADLAIDTFTREEVELYISLSTSRTVRQRFTALRDHMDKRKEMLADLPRSGSEEV